MLKSDLLASVNRLRVDAKLPPFTLVQASELTRSDLERIEYELCTPAFDHRKAKKEPTVAQLLARLNVYRRKLDQKPIKVWKDSRTNLLIAIGKANVAQRAKVEVKKCAPAIADGAETKRNHTSLHKNKLAKTVVAQHKRDDRIFRGTTAAQHALCERIAKQINRPVHDVARWLLAHPLVTWAAKHRCDADDKKRIRTWLDSDEGQSHVPVPVKAGRKVRAKINGERQPSAKRGGDILTPADLAAALKIDARAMRVQLRKREKDIPADHRVQGVRWGFPKSSEKFLVNLFGGK